MNKVIALIIFLIFVTLGLSKSWARGGDLINNGGGIAEKNMVIAYEQLDTYIRLCISSQQCKVDQEQRQLLQTILSHLPEEKRQANQLVFMSEKNQPGTFIIDDHIKIAKTGSTVGSPIYINTDLLYSRDEIGNYVPLSVNECVAVLVHEMGHHYGDYSHGQLDLLGIRVALLLELKTYRTPLLPWSQKISAAVVNPDINNGYPQFLLYVEDAVYDLSQSIAENIYCPKLTIPIPILPIPDLVLSKTKPQGVLIHNVHWEKFKDKGDNTTLSISANLSLKCKKDSGNVRVQDFKMELSFNVLNKGTPKWALDPASIHLEQKKDAWWKIIDFNF